MITKDEIPTLLTIDALLEKYTIEFHEEFIEQFLYVFESNPIITAQTLDKCLVLQIALTEIFPITARVNRKKLAKIDAQVDQIDNVVMKKLLELNSPYTEETLTLAVLTKDSSIVHYHWKRGAKADNNTLNVSLLHLKWWEVAFFLKEWFIACPTELVISEKTYDIACVRLAHIPDLYPYIHALLNNEITKINEYLVNRAKYDCNENILERIKIIIQNETSIFIPSLEPLALAIRFGLSPSIITALQEIIHQNPLQRVQLVLKTTSAELMNALQKDYFNLGWEHRIFRVKSARTFCLELKKEEDQQEDVCTSSIMQNSPLVESNVKKPGKSTNQFSLFNEKNGVGKKRRLPNLSSPTKLEPPSKKPNPGS